MSYIQYGFTFTNGQKESLAKAINKKIGYTLRLKLSQLSGNDHLGITKTQYNKIMKAKSKGKNIELKLSKSQLTKNGGAIGALLSRMAPAALNLVKAYGPKLLGTLGLAAMTGAVSGATRKAVGGGGGGSGKKSGGILALLGKIFGFGTRPDNLTPEQILYLKQATGGLQLPGTRRAAGGLQLPGTKRGGLGPLAAMTIGSLAMPLISKLFGAGIKNYGDMSQQQIRYLSNLKKFAMGLRLPVSKNR